MGVKQMRIAMKRKRNATFVLRAILLGSALVTAFSMVHAQGKRGQKPAARQPSAESGKETFLKYCASCHGKDAKGHGPAAFVLRTAPPDLTTLSKRHENKYPKGYVSAVLIFGKSFASHGSEDMPIWGSRFKTLDPVHDPTGQQHVDDLVAFLASLQAK